MPQEPRAEGTAPAEASRIPCVSTKTRSDEVSLPAAYPGFTLGLPEGAPYSSVTRRLGEEDEPPKCGLLDGRRRATGVKPTEPGAEPNPLPLRITRSPATPADSVTPVRAAGPIVWSTSF